MAPKKKGGGKGKTKGAGGNIIDGVDTSQMTREQLETFCRRIKEENEREREERNFFQIERDKLRTFWEITKNELEDVKAKLRNKDKQIEETNETNEEELKLYKQKVKYLQYEHQNHLTECKAEALVSFKMMQDDYISQQREILNDKSILKKMLREQELSHQDQIKCLKLKHAEEISRVRIEFENKEKELDIKYEQKFTDLTQDLNVIHKMEMTEIEERKNNQIRELVSHHQRIFNEMKNYYNDITLNNLALISCLNDQTEVLRKQNEEMSKQVTDVTIKNRKLTEPLKEAEAEVTESKTQLENYKKDKMALVNCKAKLISTQKALDDLKWSNDALQLRFDQLQVENNELKRRFVTAVLEVQQKTSRKNIILQKQIESLKLNFEGEDADFLTENFKSAIQDTSHLQIKKEEST